MAKILMIGDGDLRSEFDPQLHASGHTTACSAKGAGAIRTARNERPDLILLDLGLAAGEGFHVLARLKINTELSHVPVIVLSTLDVEAHERDALKAGACAYLQKPFDGEDLLDAISAALR
jgi:DNA-binding response OmpR family regulator